ncbi:DUF2690 domain-containing protein [Kitasatospora sp. McL0602]|uniref:DUF2690 domain-containing protein n=1 Tax=Kitasatospora sp. McL0602 TaxID=3439530 RepID=UPI003F89025F
MRTVRNAATLTAALLLAATGVAALPGTASAAGSCSGAGCTGKDPQAAGCGDDAVTSASFSGASVRVELRYSPSCHAAWARAAGAPAGQALFVENTRGAKRQVSIRNGQTTVWTTMIDGTVKARACLGPANSDAITCTGWA